VSSLTQAPMAPGTGAADMSRDVLYLRLMEAEERRLQNLDGDTSRQ
jgi:hypothetical protein